MITMAVPTGLALFNCSIRIEAKKLKIRAKQDGETRGRMSKSKSRVQGSD
jgi:hypothetical protein